MTSFRRWGALALPLLVAPAAACSSTPGGAPSAGEPASGGEPLTEAARVKAFLDARYTAADVRYSFRTHAGQDVDCVDFFAEPGVKAMAARGEPLSAMPQPPPLPEAVARKHGAERPLAHPVEDISFHGQPDANGRPQRCPEGTVPEVRITAEEIARAGGLDAYVGAHAPRVLPGRRTAGDPPGPFVCDPNQEYPTYAHVVGTLVNGDHALGYGDSSMAIYGPNVPGTWGDHSLSQIWLYSGSNTAINGAPCTSNCVQSIEVGWDVDNVVNLYDKSTPHIFLFSTSDGYSHTGCYNNVPNSSYSCVPWVPAANAQYSLNQWLAFNPPANTGGQDPRPEPTELETTIIQIGGNYWVLLSVTGGPSSYIGYFPGSDFSAPMTTFQVGGEVDDQTGTFMNTGLQMGSGYAPTAGYGWAAFHHDYAAAWADSSGQTQWQFDADLCAMRPNEYTYSTAPGAAKTTWGSFFYYGGDPKCTVTTCQAQGATCGTIDNGCGTPLQCGTCGAGDVCEGNTCVCAPKTCRAGWYWNSADCACEKVIKCGPLVCQ